MLPFMFDCLKTHRDDYRSLNHVLLLLGVVAEVISKMRIYQGAGFWFNSISFPTPHHGKNQRGITASLLGIGVYLATLLVGVAEEHLS